ncbi:hypothetical protein [Pedobacter sp. ASV28]|uniref:hypothetical protein n=1 Tax=Pedobacter sp. ASV28 TaxID=2795123 RepID=UPI0018EA6421|nr:hypothetical protein [Pedobacter sp. ASV28]
MTKKQNISSEIFTRKLPVIVIENIEFYVDAYHSMLIEKENEINKIYALEMMRFEDHFEFILDISSRRIYDGKWMEPLPDEARYIWIRPLWATDPEGMDLFYKDNNSVRLGDNADLPVIKIGGFDFYVDDLRNSYREVANKWNLINFKEVIKQGEEYGIYFDSVVKNAAFPHEVEGLKTSGSDHIAFVKLPSGQALADIIKEHRTKISSANMVNTTDQKERKKRKSI